MQALLCCARLLIACVFEQEIFRRSFASRALPPAVVARFGIKHVRGMLLYGPPGTGKTLIARQIGMQLCVLSVD